MQQNEEVPVKSDSLKQYINEISNYSLITVEEEMKLAKQIHGNNEVEQKKALETLILSNLRLVVKIAHDFRGCGLPIADLISEGNIGLMRASKTFDPTLGSKFSTYAAWWIKQTMRRAIANQTRTIRVPVQTGNKMCRIRQTKILLKTELGREPSDLEIAEYLDFSERTVSTLRRAESSIFSLQDQITVGEEGSFEDLIADPHAIQPDTGISNDDSMELLQESLELLDPREREIIAMRFFENKTLDEVSHMIGRTRERVRQIQNQALLKLRSLMKEECEVVSAP
jgi:RNA polymerase primary sigma factor